MAGKFYRLAHLQLLLADGDAMAAAAAEDVTKARVQLLLGGGSDKDIVDQLNDPFRRGWFGHSGWRMSSVIWSGQARRMSPYWGSGEMSTVMLLEGFLGRSTRRAASLD